MVTARSVCDTRVGGNVPPTVEPTTTLDDPLLYLVAGAAGTAEVDNLDVRALSVLEEYILWLQVAVDYIHLFMSNSRNSSSSDNISINISTTTIVNIAAVVRTRHIHIYH